MMNVTLIFPDVMVVIQRLDDDWGGRPLLQSCSNPAPQEGEICQNLASHGVSGKWGFQQHPDVLSYWGN